jgi:hypothetical protein
MNYFSTKAKEFQKEKTVFVQQMVLEQDIHMEKTNNLNPYNHKT